MRIIKYTIIFLFANLLLFAESKVVSLKDCISIAMQNNPDIFVSHEDFNKSIYLYKIAKAQSGVQVNTGIYTREVPKDAETERIIKIPGKDTDVGLFAGMNATYNLYDPQKFFREESARLSIDITKLNSLNTKNRIITNVKNAYYDYIFSKENSNFLEKKFKQSEIRKKQAVIQHENGALSILELTKVDLDYTQVKLEVEKMKNTERLKLNDLYNSIGVKSSENFNFIPKFETQIYELKFSLEDYYKLAEIFNSEINIARLNKKTSRLAIDSRRAQHDPSVSLILSLGFLNSKIEGMDRYDENYKKKNWIPTFGGTITSGLPIYTGGAISASVDSAIIDYNKSVYNERNVITKIKNSISNTYENQIESAKQYTLSKLILEQTKKQFIMIKNRYESGLATKTELDVSEMTILESELNHMQLVINHYKALANLSNLIGLDEDYLCKK